MIFAVVEIVCALLRTEMAMPLDNEYSCISIIRFSRIRGVCMCARTRRRPKKQYYRGDIPVQGGISMARCAHPNTFWPMPKLSGISHPFYKITRSCPVTPTCVGSSGGV